ncbi:MAG: DPP IV N-terminal domain-containing protein [Phycisphaerales bacterium]|nr:DPP IV N-terminal domain-containing protein [Phycisphaerales bacterium]
MKYWFISFVYLCYALPVFAQSDIFHWSTKQSGVYYDEDYGSIIEHHLQANTDTPLMTKDVFIPEGQKENLPINNFIFSPSEKKVLIFTNAKRTWRFKDVGNYWVYDVATKKGFQIAPQLPNQSLRYAQFSPNERKVAFVSGNNLFVEDINTQTVTQLTFNKSITVTNGYFDWVYEEEFSCHNGFQWSPDSKKLVYWQIDDAHIPVYKMINNTDSLYPFTINYNYPEVGAPLPICRVGVVNISTTETKWIKIPGNKMNSYVPRMDWIPNSQSLIMQQLDRKQQNSMLYIANMTDNSIPADEFLSETDSAWIDIAPGPFSHNRDNGYNHFTWVDNGKAFIWASDRDGWHHLYLLGLDADSITLLTVGNYDVVKVAGVDEKDSLVYFIASPNSTTERYLYYVSFAHPGNLTKVTPDSFCGVNDYDIAPDGLFAKHSFSNYNTRRIEQWISLPDHRALGNQLIKLNLENHRVEFFNVSIDSNISLPAYKVFPDNFDSTKKYPTIFYFYGEPASSTVLNTYGIDNTWLYNGDNSADGYIQISIDPRGTPVPLGANWRKCIYKKLGVQNVDDLAKAVAKIEQAPYIDTNRTITWGWSGGGSTVFNLLFRYPNLFKAGIAIAGISNLLLYDNIYEERYLGLVSDDRQPYLNGSAMNYVAGLKAHLLIVQGTGDDNVHYQNLECLVNELIKHQKQFQIMAYPNRSHGIREYEGTREHLYNLFTNYVRTYCPMGGVSKSFK